MGSDVFQEYMGRCSTDDLTVASGQTISNAADLEGRSLVALAFPAVWDGGVLTLQASPTATGTYQDIYSSSDGLIVSFTPTAARTYGLTGNHYQAAAPLRYIRLKATSAVAADRIVTVIAKSN